MSLYVSIPALILTMILAQPSYASYDTLTVERAFKIRLNDDDLVQINRDLEQNLLGTEQRYVLPDIKAGKIPLILDLTGIEIKYIQKSLRLTLLDNSVAVQLGFENLRFSVQSTDWGIQLLDKKYVQNCRQLNLVFSEGKTLLFQTKLDLKVQDNKIHLSDSSTALPLNHLNLDTYGPEECKGIPPHISQTIVRQLANVARPAMELIAIQIIRGSMPHIANYMTDRSNIRFDIDLSHAPILNQKMIALQTFPQEISISQDEINITLGLSVQNAAQDTPLRLIEKSSRSEISSRIGFNPKIIEVLLKVAGISESSWFELDESIIPELRNILSIKNLATVWPDLNSFEKIEPYARIRVQLQRHPEIRSDSRAQGISLSNLKLRFVFSINTQGSWVDYASIQSDFDMVIVSKIANSRLNVSFTKFEVNPFPEWASSYNPKDLGSNFDEASTLIKMLTERLLASDSLKNIPLSGFYIFEHHIEFEELYFGDEFVEISLRI